MKVRWKRESRTDLREIRTYIAKNSPRNAANFVARIVDSTRRLEDFPESGSPLHEYPESGYREIFVDHYRVVFAIGRYVSILRVIRGDRLLKLSDLDVS